MRLRSLASASLLVLIACSGDPSSPDTGSTTGGTGQGGAATGGTATGGVAPGTGGTTGGTAVATGGSQASTGGFSASTGGTPANTGGSATTGGFSFGGSSTGGSSTGGSSTGGANTGGFSFGGKSAGGASSGGNGGNGGSKSSGGASSGGGGGGSSTLTFAALCGTCHGPNGEGVTSLGPEIQHPTRDFATWVVRNGRQGHPSFPSSVMAAFPASALPDATLNSFFDALSTPTIPKPTTGAALYKDYCSNCHSATGTGGTAGHNAKGQPLSTVTTMVRSGHSLTQFSSRNSYMPKWTASELSDADIGLIVTYLGTL